MENSQTANVKFELHVNQFVACEPIFKKISDFTGENWNANSNSKRSSSCVGCIQIAIGLSGTMISGNKPIAAISGCTCGVTDEDVDGCDYEAVSTGWGRNSGSFRNEITFDRVVQPQRFMAHSKANVIRIFLVPNLCKSDFLLLRYGQPNMTPGFDAIAQIWARGRRISRIDPTLRARSRSKLHSFSRI